MLKYIFIEDPRCIQPGHSSSAVPSQKAYVLIGFWAQIVSLAGDRII